MFWWYDTLSCHVLLACFLAPDNLPPPHELSDREPHLAVIWPDHDREAHGYRLHTHSLCTESAYDIDTLSQLEWAVFRPWKATLLSVIKVVLSRLWTPVKAHHCCSCWQFKVKQQHKKQWKLIQHSKTPLPHSWQIYQLVVLCIFS